MTQYFLNELSLIPIIKVYGTKDAKKQAAVISINIGNQDSSEVSFILDSVFDIATRSCLHCGPLPHKTMNTLEQGTVRFSIGYFNTKEDIDKAVKALKSIVDEIK